ncbi:MULTISPECIES: AraC family transcriptional regulator [Phyllobacteriaceae]|uniref:AraC family transcriptional regulator n=1 Tax=Phyllobacteriaceae TaxID=69277 RepID=UPI002AC9FD47|nr:AraC family transcriptional regulator [Chelativorans sp. M5D2P16]MDZ5698513.1 AraC family transcriptional regulator [Chelativorans sp. M5D2P16]
MLRINPAYEVIVCAPTESFRWYVHDYPHHLAKWHYHPEYELHLIQGSTGRMMIGDYVGPFTPGTLVLTGPNLPHNWVSDIGPNERITDRDMLIQFSEEFARSLISGFAELKDIQAMLEESVYGLEFTGDAAEEGRRLLGAIGEAGGPRRLILFIELMAALANAPSQRRMLSRCAPAIGVYTSQSKRLQNVINYIFEHYRSEIPMNHAAKLCGMEISTFSRFFKKQTGHTFVRFINQLRVHHACTLLAETDLSVTEICFDSGFNNTANFNRQFATICGQTPSEYRRSSRAVTAPWAA